MDLFSRFYEFYKGKSLPCAIYDAYKSIDSTARSAFWIVFIACNIIFGFHTIHFLWGNHDWLAVFESYGAFAESYAGRYTQNAISLFVQGQRVLPILNNTIAFFALSMAGIFLCMYFGMPKMRFIWVIIGLLLTLAPFTLTRLYYVFQVAGLFTAIAVGIFGLLLAKNIALIAKSSKIKSYLLCALSIFCLHFGIASYQPFINTIFSLLCGGIITLIIDTQGNLKTAIYKSRFMIASAILGALSYKIALDVLKMLGIVAENYNNQMTPFAEIPARIALIAKMSLENLVSYEYAFLPQSLTWLFLVFVLMLVMLIFALPFKIHTKIAIFALLLLSLFSTLTHIVISKTIINDATTDFYGLAFWRVMIVALVFKVSFALGKREKYAWAVRNSAFLLGAIVLWIYAICDLHAQRMQKFAFDSHTTTIKTIVAKIETLEGFSYGKKYHFLMFGDLTNMRHRYGKPYFDELPQDKIKSSGRGLGGYGTLIPTWSPLQAFEFYMPNAIKDADKGNFGDYLDGHRDNKHFQSLIMRLHKAGILARLKPYPHKDSIVLFEDIIVLVASKGHLDEVRELVKGW